MTLEWPGGCCLLGSESSERQFRCH